MNWLCRCSSECGILRGGIVAHSQPARCQAHITIVCRHAHAAGDIWQLHRRLTGLWWDVLAGPGCGHWGKRHTVLRRSGIEPCQAGLRPEWHDVSQTWPCTFSAAVSVAWEKRTRMSEKFPVVFLLGFSMSLILAGSGARSWISVQWKLDVYFCYFTYMMQLDIIMKIHHYHHFIGHGIGWNKTVFCIFDKLYWSLWRVWHVNVLDSRCAAVERVKEIL